MPCLISFSYSRRPLPCSTSSPSRPSVRRPPRRTPSVRKPSISLGPGGGPSPLALPRPHFLLDRDRGLDMFETIRNVVRNHELILSFAVRDIKARYKQTA